MEKSISEIRKSNGHIGFFASYMVRFMKCIAPMEKSIWRQPTIFFRLEAIIGLADSTVSTVKIHGEFLKASIL